MQQAYSLHPFANTESVNFNFNIFLFSFSMIENCMVHANIIPTKRMLSYQTSSFSGLGRCSTSYNWKAMAMKWSPRTLA